MNVYKIIPVLSLLLLIASCGKDGGSSSDGKVEDSLPGGQEERQSDPIPPDGSNINGTYTARFVTLNPQVNGTIPGSATFMRQDDKFFAYLRLFAGMPKAWHMQHVYTGDRCPTQNDDLNLDGFIDIVEAEAVLGKILIPLDSDISSQNSGRRFFPLADLSGSYHYERVTSFRRFFADLKSTDKDPDDNLVKLAPDEGLVIEGRLVLIQGISEDVELPETVASLDRRRPFQTFPIACGIYQKVEGLPGVTHNDEDPIPGPIADVEEGQDQPAPDEDEDQDDTSDGSGSENDTNDSDDGNGPVSDGEGRRPDRTTSGSGSGSDSGPGSETGSDNSDTPIPDTEEDESEEEESEPSTTTDPNNTSTSEPEDED